MARSYQFIGIDSFDLSGFVSSAGDVDGDGTSTGEIYPITVAADGVINLGNVNEQSASYQLVGTENTDRAGWSVSSAGNVEGDGRDE